MSQAAKDHSPEADTTLLTPPTLPSTRLYPPRLRANFVERSSVITTLSDDPERRLTVITAPAGYGKSTLAAQWVARLALPTAWVRLEATDDGPRSFFALVLAALHPIDRDLAAGTALLLSDGGEPHAETIVHRLIEDLSVTTRSFVLVLDDYHAIEAQAIHLAMDLLLEHVPATMRLMLISRTMPPLRLARLQTSGELLLVRKATCSSPRRRRCSTSTTLSTSISPPARSG